MIRFLLLNPFMWLRWRYATWALQYVPPLVDGQFNDEYQRLSNWANEYDRALEKYLRGEQR